MPDAVWVISNRQDDRMVLWERDADHPYGEAFVGGGGPAFVGRTPRIDVLIREGSILVIDEPPDSRKKPRPARLAGLSAPADMPGQPIRLGRVIDPTVLSPASEARIVAQQAAAPGEIPVPSAVIVPPPPLSRRTVGRR